MESISESELERKIREKVIYYLHRRDHSEKELRQKLTPFEYPIHLINKVLDWAKDRNYLMDPQQLSQRHVERLQKKKKSRSYIQNYLRQKGLPTSPIDPHEEFQNALSLAKALLEKLQNRKRLNTLETLQLDSHPTETMQIDTSNSYGPHGTPVKNKKNIYRPKSPSDLEKIGRQLLSRGFSPEVVRKVIYEELRSSQ